MSDATQIFSEFLGTAILVLLGMVFVRQSKSKAEASGWIVIATGWATAVTIAVYASGFMGPAHLNPAVTLGMAMTGNFLGIGGTFHVSTVSRRDRRCNSCLAQLLAVMG